MIRSLLSLLFCAVFVLTGHSVGAARGSDRAVDQMVICTGNQSSVIYVDGQGAPVSVPHHCPDCTLHGPDEGLADAVRPGAAQLCATQARLAQQATRSLRQSGPARARAPPLRA